MNMNMNMNNVRNMHLVCAHHDLIQILEYRSYNVSDELKSLYYSRYEDGGSVLIKKFSVN